MAKRQKMTTDDLVGIIDTELSTSHSYNAKISNERALAFQYFNSEPYGNETKGRSSYVSSEVLETISWAIPQIIKVFETNDSVVKFDPVSPDTVDCAELATQYCEYVFRKQNRGFDILYTMVFDALLQKNGVVKIFFDPSIEYVREEYQDLDDLQASQLLDQPGVEPIERETTENEVPGIVPDENGIPQLGTVTQRSHNISIKRPKKGGQGKIRIENVPPEELIVSRLTRSTNLDECPFIVHQVKKTISWLREQGYDIPDDIADTSPYTTDYSPEALARQEVDGAYLYINDNAPTADPSLRLVHVVEAYLQIDWNNDGIAEWRKVTKVGSRILDNEECYYQPFVSTSPMPMPHKYYGMSLADLVMDLQYLKSLLMRAMLDSFAFNINPARAVNATAVIDMNDLLDTDPGGWIRLRGEVNNNLMTLPNAGVGDSAFNLLEYVDNIAESRSGVSRYTQGIDENSFNKTATGTQAIMNASQEKIALITRIMADSGLAEIYKKILKTASSYITEEQLIRSGSVFITVHPRKWMDLETLTSNVGTGALDSQADAAHAQQILQLQTQLLQAQRPDLTSMVDAQKIYNAGAALLKSLGKKNVDDFFNNPQSQYYQQNLQAAQKAAAAPPPPDPMVQAAQIEAQMVAQKNQQEGMIKSAQFQQDVKNEDREFELKKAEIELKYGIEQEKLRQADRSFRADLLQQGIAAVTSPDGQDHILPADVLQQIHDVGFRHQAEFNAQQLHHNAQFAEALAQVGHGLNHIVNHLTAPKIVLRDEKGNVVGVQSAAHTAPSNNLNQSLSHLTAPKQLMRDGTGNILGTQTIAPQN